jgi:drug/metabolite transporter (DMT)-like permease
MSKNSSNLSFRVAMVLAAAFWGFATVMTKGALGLVPPLTLLVVQLAVSIVFLWAMVIFRRSRLSASKQTLQIGLIGLLNPGIAYTFGLLGLTLTTATMYTLIWAAEPILILGLAWLILRERLTQPLLVLSTLAIIGVFLVLGIDPSVGYNSSILGNALVLAGVFCCALYTVLTRRTMAQLDPIAVVALQQTVAFIWALLIWPIELSNAGTISLATISPGAWAWAAASGIFYYALAFWFYLTGLRKTPASLAGLFLNLIPIFAIGGAYIFLGERLVAVQWIGAFLILAAVVGIMSLPKTETVSAAVKDVVAIDS